MQLPIRKNPKIGLLSSCFYFKFDNCPSPQFFPCCILVSCSMADFGSSPASCMPEKAKLHIAMMIFQLGYGGNHVVMKIALNMGVSKLVYPFYRNIVALLALAPFAYFLEKRERPKLTLYFLIQFFVLGAIGITLNQGFYIFGLYYTSPTLASATENSVPAITFIMAVLLGMEQVHWTRKDGIAKVIGTIVSVTGALVITLYKGPTIYSSDGSSEQSVQSSLGDALGTTWTIGCICLMGHALCWSGWIVLQAPFLKKYPARFSFVSYSCFFSVLQFGAIAACIDRDIEAWQISSVGELLTILYTGLVASAMVFAIQIYVIDRAGPLFVSMYLPVQTLVAAIMSTLILGEAFYLGGIIGGALLIIGLYLVVLGKSEESKYESQKTVIPSLSENNPIEDPAEESSLIQPLLHSCVSQRNEP